jgi:hypothetical protein
MVRHGIGYVPEGRHVFAGLSVLAPPPLTARPSVPPLADPVRRGR